jgi:23S rRNA pseudouridine2605 synthase
MDPFRRCRRRQQVVMIVMMAMASAFTAAPSLVRSFATSSSSAAAAAVARRAGTAARTSPPASSTTTGATATGANNAAPQRPFRLFARPHKKDNLFRADRVVANRSGRSRKEVFRMLQERRIVDVNGTIIDGPSAKIRNDAILYIDGKDMVPLPPPLLAVYHKPKWVLSARTDPLGRPCLDKVLTDMHPVGRLDYDTTGLLFFSSSGPLTQTLLHPKHAVEKEYVATVVNTVDEEKLRQRLVAGVTTGEGVHTAVLTKVDHWTNASTVSEYLAKLKAEIPISYNTTDLTERGYLDIFDATALSTVTLTVQEGKHRMVRRMLANVGHAVVSLHRRRLGVISLCNNGENENDLPVGATRNLYPHELEWAQSLVTSHKRKKSRRFDDDDDETSSFEDVAEVEER